MQCVTVSYGKVKGRAKRYPYFQPALYKLVPRKSDGVATWRYVSHLGGARRSIRLAKQDARDFSAEENLPFVEGVRHGDKLKAVR